MMDDSLISATKVVMWLLWGLVVALLAAAWVVGMQGHTTVAGLLGMTACATSAAAAVAHIRLYSMSVCAQLRVMRAELDRARPSGVRGL